MDTSSLDATNLLKHKELIDRIAKKLASAFEAEIIDNTISHHLENNSKMRRRIIRSIIASREFKRGVLQKLKSQITSSKWSPALYHKTIMKANSFLGFKNIVHLDKGGNQS